MRSVFAVTAVVICCFSAQAGTVEDQVERLRTESEEQEREIEEAKVAEPSRHEAGKPTDAEMKKKIKRALERFRHEPTLGEMQRAALRFADADKESAKRWLSAPNRAAVLPVLKFVADRDFERDESLDRAQDDPDKWGADTDDDLGLQISAQWNLGELIFNPDEVRVYSALSDRASRREALLTVLVGYFFERRRLQLKAALAPPENMSEMVDLVMRIDELTASIDALTGGLLSSTLKSRKGSSN